MDIAEISQVIKDNCKKLESFVVAEEGVYFATFLPSIPGTIKNIRKIRLALKKKGADVSKITHGTFKAYGPSVTMFRTDNFEIIHSFAYDEITDLMVLNIVEIID